MIEFQILGQPIPHQAFRDDGDDNRTDPLREVKRAFLIGAMGDIPKETINGPLCVKLTFHMERPADHFETRKRIKGVLKPCSPRLHTVAPDTIDLAKFILDILESVAWERDMICDLQIKKQYSSNPRTEIEIMEASE